MLKHTFIMVGAMFAGATMVAAEVQEGAGHEYDNIKLVQKADVNAKVLPATLTADLNKVIRKCDVELFGLSFDNFGNDVMKLYKAAPGQAYPTLSPDWLKAAQGLIFPLNRVFIREEYWRDSIGPIAQRKPHKKAGWDPVGDKQVCGPLELVKALRQIDPQAQFNIVVELTPKTAAEVHDLAELLIGNANTVWGKKRIENGVPDPVIPRQWELGNERDWSAGKITAEEYVKLARAVMAEIRKVQPDAKFSLCSATAPWHEIQKKGWRHWNQTLLKELGKEAVSFSFHPYYHGYPMSLLEDYMKIIGEDIAKSPNPQLRIFVSEYGKWPGGKPGRWENSWFLTHALTACLSAAEWMNRMLAHPEVDIMTMHAFSSGPWGMFYADEYSGKIYGTGLADLFRFYRLLPLGGEVVECSLTGDETSVTDGKLSFSASVIKHDGKLYMMVVNRLPNTSRALKVNLPGMWKLAEDHCLTGPDLESVNTAADRPIRALALPPKETGGVVMIPPRSVNILVWQK